MIWSEVLIENIYYIACIIGIIISLISLVLVIIHKYKDDYSIQITIDRRPNNKGTWLAVVNIGSKPVYVKSICVNGEMRIKSLVTEKVNTEVFYSSILNPAGMLNESGEKLYLLLCKETDFEYMEIDAFIKTNIIMKKHWKLKYGLKNTRLLDKGDKSNK